MIDIPSTRPLPVTTRFLFSTPSTTMMTPSEITLLSRERVLLNASYALSCRLVDPMSGRDSVLEATGNHVPRGQARESFVAW